MASFALPPHTLSLHLSSPLISVSAWFPLQHPRFVWHLLFSQFVPHFLLILFPPTCRCSPNWPACSSAGTVLGVLWQRHLKTLLLMWRVESLCAAHIPWNLAASQSFGLCVDDVTFFFSAEEDCGKQSPSAPADLLSHCYSVQRVCVSYCWYTQYICYY